MNDRWRTALSIAATFVATILSSRGAEAQAAQREISWREPRVPESDQTFAFELRFGPYRPNIDETFPQQKPYETVFGTSPRLSFGFEIDWQAIRIPFLGTFGPGFGWSYTHMSANAVFETTGQPSAEESTLGIMPVYGVGVLRIDEIARRTPIPVVAYGKAGLGYGLYWSGNDLGVQRRGNTWGTHFAVGGMLLLDRLDNHASAELDNEWGVNNTYLFFEWMASNLDGFASKTDRSVMRIGTNTWVLGLAFEM